MTYRENDTSLNPYWDGTELDVALLVGNIWLLDEAALADEPPIIEGSPNALAIEWVAEIAPPLWVSNEAREAAATEAIITETRNETHKTNPHTEDPFTDYFEK